MRFDMRLLDNGGRSSAASAIDVRALINVVVLDGPIFFGVVAKARRATYI